MGWQGVLEWWRERRAKRCNVIVIGLDRAGKSTMVNALTGRADRKVVPTVGVSQPRVLEREGKSGAVR